MFTKSIVFLFSATGLCLAVAASTMPDIATVEIFFNCYKNTETTCGGVLTEEQCTGACRVTEFPPGNLIVHCLGGPVHGVQVDPDPAHLFNDITADFTGNGFESLLPPTATGLTHCGTRWLCDCDPLAIAAGCHAVEDLGDLLVPTFDVQGGPKCKGFKL